MIPENLNVRSIFYINFKIYYSYVNICVFLTIIIYQQNIFLREIIYFSQDQRGLWKKIFFFFSESERITFIIAWCKSRVRNFSSTESATSIACNIPQIRDAGSRIWRSFPGFLSLSIIEDLNTISENADFPKTKVNDCT